MEACLFRGHRFAFDEASTRLEIMEAASRPVFEPLSDLPVEAPIDEGVPVGAAPSPSGGSAQAGSRKAGTEDDSTEELIDPESLLGTSEPDLLLAAMNEAATSAATDRKSVV